MPEKPNPGSKEAKVQGCTCPVLDNCHGKFPPRGKYGWVIFDDCPLHWELAASQLNESRNPEGGPGDRNTHAC